MSRFVQSQECIITLKSADNAVVKRHGPRSPPHIYAWGNTGNIIVLTLSDFNCCHWQKNQD